MREKQALEARRWTPEVSLLRASLFAPFHLGSEPPLGAHQAPVARVVRARGAGVPTTPVPSSDRALLSAGSCDVRLQEELRGPLAGQLEIDETTFGGARHGKRGWGAAGKVIVFGILKRNGLVRVFPVPVRNSQEIVGRVVAETRPW